MTNEKKASKVLNYLSELDGECIISVLHPLIDNDKLAGLYDDFYGLLIEEEEM